MAVVKQATKLTYHSNVQTVYDFLSDTCLTENIASAITKKGQRETHKGFKAYQLKTLN